jgi:Zn-dependent M28 family amino/carboxypeptidase
VDNGSGVAVALEVASILATPTIAQPPRTVRIVLFDAEEVGLLGSEDYATALTTAGETIGCVVNADMIGWAMPPTAGRFWYVFDEASRSWAGLGLEAIELFVPTARPITTNYGDAGRSNSTSFWAGGMCAVGLSCWPRDPSNHTPDDTSSTFQPAVFHDTSRGAIAVAAAWMYSTTDP